MLARIRRRLLCFVLVLATPAFAQDRPADEARRDSLEARVRSRMTQILRTQVQLDDEQLRRLQAHNRRFEGQRRGLLEQERRVRIELRAAIELGDSTQNPKVASLLDRTIQLQRERLELLEAEQRELATFLTPLQRAKLYGVEEQMRRRMQDMRDAGPPGRRGPGTGARTPMTRRPPEAR